VKKDIFDEVEEMLLQVWSDYQISKYEIIRTDIWNGLTKLKKKYRRQMK